MKSFLGPIVMNTLNGISMGVIVALIPGALVNQLIKFLLPSFPQLAFITTLTSLAALLLPMTSAACVGMVGKLSPIHTAALILAAVAGAGNFHFTKTGFQAQGSGDVINLALTIFLGYLLLELIGSRLQAYTILLVPLIVLVVAGGTGSLTLQPVSQIAQGIGIIINQFNTLQPVLMSVLMAIAFAFLIVSPISSVGIATAIGINGLAAGAANLGIVAASFALAIYGWKANSVGTSLAHFLGSPKIQMANLIKRPRLFLPILLNAGIAGGIGSFFQITGTPLSAGFGFSGLIGPLVALEGFHNNTWLNIGIIVLNFLILPITLSLVSNYLWQRKLHYFQASDFALNYE
ncbi:PTS sugar transporter subunit IIC [Bombilactobacillus apium]|uniref:PTS sugar transporter subunit IIC n=1 Tax=Bombilactobacillus apium TaxID=2675299 RepID=UPI0038992306